MDAEVLRAMLLDQETFSFAVVHYCVLLYDKSNANSIHKRALGGDDAAVNVMRRVERFNDSRFRLVEQMRTLPVLENSFETLVTCDQVEEYDMGSKVLLVCSKRRGATRCFVLSKDILPLYNAIFYVHHFDNIIKESFLGFIKKDSKKTAILGHMCWSMWCLFTEKVSVLLDFMQVDVERK